MKKGLRLQVVLAIAAVGAGTLLIAGCSLSGLLGGLVGNGLADEMVFSTEVEQPSGSSSNASPLSGSVAAVAYSLNASTVGQVVDNSSVTLNGKVSGTLTVQDNMTWNDTGTQPDTKFNRTWNFSGSRTLSFNNYSDFSSLTVSSGTVTDTVASSPTATLANSTNGTTAAAGVPVTSTATNVQKTIKGTLNLIYDGTSYNATVNLVVTVTKGVLDWTIGSTGSGSFYLKDPTVSARNVTVKGTVTVNGKTQTINKTITSTNYS